MISKDNFIGTIGYDGLSAVVDKNLKGRIKDKTVDQLLELGEFKCAAALAIYNKSEEEQQKVVDKYNSLSNSNYTIDNLARLFGVATVDTKKIISL